MTSGEEVCCKDSGAGICSPKSGELSFYLSPLGAVPLCVQRVRKGHGICRPAKRSDGQCACTCCRNCGSCGNRCASGRVCSYGECVCSSGESFRAPASAGCACALVICLSVWGFGFLPFQNERLQWFGLIGGCMVLQGIPAVATRVWTYRAASTTVSDFGSVAGTAACSRPPHAAAGPLKLGSCLQVDSAGVTAPNSTVGVWSLPRAPIAPTEPATHNSVSLSARNTRHSSRLSAIHIYLQPQHWLSIPLVDQRHLSSASVVLCYKTYPSSSKT